jgi:hypothetical protein
MSIGSINSSSASMMMSGMKGMQRPDPSKMADQLFSKLDTKGQGYIEKGDLQADLTRCRKLVTPIIQMSPLPWTICSQQWTVTATAR